MKTLIKILLCFQMFLFTPFIHKANAKDDYSKVIRREFTINPTGQLTISNKFGKIQCYNWEKNTVSVEVVITVAASGQKEADRIMERISVDISGTPDQVTAITSITEGKPSNSRFSVDYNVNLPSTVDLDLTNKFGDIYINEAQGKAKLNLSYGNLDLKQLGNSDNLVDLKFGKARIGRIKGAVVLSKYSELDIDYAGSLRLDSKFSDVKARQVIALNVNIEGGDLDLENTSAMESKSKFTDLDIGRIEKSLNLDIQYGDFEVREIPVDFSVITIRNKYAEVNLGISKQAAYSLEADLRFCELSYPSENAKFSYRSTTPTSSNYKGIIGGEREQMGKVTVHSEFGDVDLK